MARPKSNKVQSLRKTEWSVDNNPVKSKWTIDSSHQDMKVVDFLSEELDKSKTHVRKWIDAQSVWLNGSVILTSNMALKKGDELLIAPEILSKPLVPECLLVNDDIVIISKPCAWTIEQTHSYMKDWLASELYTVHRLDMMTSGLMIFARHERAKRELHLAFKERKLTKAYVALTLKGDEESYKRGWQEFEDLLIKKRSSQFSAFMECSNRGGDRAKMHVRRLSFSDRADLWLCRPKTGRMHQIRVQMSSRGYEIVGDRDYGTHSDDPSLRPHLSLAYMGHFLHSYGLKIPQEVLGYPVEMFCPFPAGWERGLRALGIRGRGVDSLLNPGCDWDKRHLSLTARKLSFEPIVSANMGPWNKGPNSSYDKKDSRSYRGKYSENSKKKSTFKKGSSNSKNIHLKNTNSKYKKKFSS